MSGIRPCQDDDLETRVGIVDAAAVAYREVIPADEWHQPYLPLEGLRREIAFYRRHGFEVAPPQQQGALLEAYWSISLRQRATSVVLAHPPFTSEGS